MNSCLLQSHYYEVKCKKPCPGFEFGLLITFCATITVTLRYICIHTREIICFRVHHYCQEINRQKDACLDRNVEMIKSVQRNRLKKGKRKPAVMRYINVIKVYNQMKPKVDITETWKLQWFISKSLSWNSLMVGKIDRIWASQSSIKQITQSKTG